MSPVHIIALLSLLWIRGGIPAHPSPDEFITMGVRAVERGEYEKAIGLYDAALRTKLGAQKEAIARYGRGVAYQGKGDADRALADYAEAIRLNPGNPDPYYSRGVLQHGKGEYDKAIADFSEALRLNPDNLNALVSRGHSSFLKGDMDHAIADYTEAIRVNPDFVDAYCARGMAWYKKDEHDKALADYRKAITAGQEAIDDSWKNAAGNDSDELAAELAQGYNRQAWVLATCPEEAIRNGKQAVEYARKACEQSQWKIPAIIDTLAAALAETGDFEGAVKFQSWYVTLDPKEKGGRERLELYKAKKPYREEKP